MFIPQIFPDYTQNISSNPRVAVETVQYNVNEFAKYVIKQTYFTMQCNLLQWHSKP